MPTEPIGQHRHADQHRGELDRIPLATPPQQQREGGFVECETECGNESEAEGCGGQRSVLVAKGQAVMAEERHPQRHQPAHQIGEQRRPLVKFDQPHHHTPMHGGGTTAHTDKQHDTVGAPERGDGTVSPGRLNHEEHEHSRTGLEEDGRRARYLCICVDDYGLSDGISAAALHLVGMRRVHALGCMVGAPAWQKWCGMARGLSPAMVDTGLHLDLTEYPLLSATRKPLTHWIAQCYAHQVDRAAVRAEIRAQLDAFVDALGRAPAYVDGHQHVHQLPIVREELVAEMMLRYGRDLKGMPWLRETRGAAALMRQAHGGWGGWAKSLVISRLGAAGLAALARRGGIPQNQALLGVYGFDANPAQYLALLLAGVRTGGDAALVMCHPSQVCDARDVIGAARLVEYEVLQSTALGSELRDLGIDLQPMSRILAAEPMRDTARRRA